MTLGPRVLKTGLAVTLALYICSFFNLSPAIFAGVAAIFTIQPSIYRTWKQVLDQLQTNTLGAIVAIISLYFFGNDPFTIGLVMIIVILISLKLKMEQPTISLTLVTVLAIMSADVSEDILFAINRFLIILIGMGTGFLVNIFVYRPKYKNNYMGKVLSVYQDLSLLLRTAVSNELTEKAFKEGEKALKKEIIKLEEQFKIFDEEREKMKKLNPQDVREIIVFKQMLKTIQQGSELLEIINEHYFQSRTSEQENHSFDEHIEQLTKYHEQFLLKFEGKIKSEETENGNDLITESSAFLEQIIQNNQHKDQNLRLVVVGSAVFEYAFQLQRLDHLVERYLRKKDT